MLLCLLGRFSSSFTLVDKDNRRIRHVVLHRSEGTDLPNRSRGVPSHRQASNVSKTYTATVSTICGSGETGKADGPATEAQFAWPSGLTALPSGGWLVTEFSNGSVRAVSSSGQVSTVKTTWSDWSAESESADQLNLENPHTFRSPLSIAVSPSNRGAVAVADRGNNMLEWLHQDGSVRHFAGGGTEGSLDRAVLLHDAKLFSPVSIAVASDGVVVMAEGVAGVSSPRIVNPHTNTMTSFAMVDEQGLPAGLPYYSRIAIGSDGSMWCASSLGVHHVTNTGLKPGYVVWAAEAWWSATTLCNTVYCSTRHYPHRAQAVRAILTTMVRSHRRQSGANSKPQTRSARQVSHTPVLPSELWFLILSFLRVHQIGKPTGQSFFHPASNMAPVL
jgi:hypothetical protein